MARFYGTFGCGQRYASKVQPIEAKDENTARRIMFRLYGPHFCTVYPEKYYNEEVIRYYSGDYLLPVRGSEIFELSTKIQTTCCHCGKVVSEEDEVVVNDKGHTYCSESCALSSSGFVTCKLTRSLAENYGIEVEEVVKDEM